MTYGLQLNRCLFSSASRGREYLWMVPIRRFNVFAQGLIEQAHRVTKKDSTVATQLLAILYFCGINKVFVCWCHSLPWETNYITGHGSLTQHKHLTLISKKKRNHTCLSCDNEIFIRCTQTTDGIRGVRLCFLRVQTPFTRTRRNIIDMKHLLASIPFPLNVLCGFHCSVELFGTLVLPAVEGFFRGCDHVTGCHCHV